MNKTSEKTSERTDFLNEVIKDSFLKLLKKKDYNRITVSDLCRCANVSRGTFYKYYGNQFDLLADMENDLLEFLVSTIREHAANPVKIIETICEYLESHLEFGRLIVNNNVDPLFPQRLFAQEILRESVMRNYGSMPDETAQEYLFNYVIYGAYRIICLWINKDQRESPEEIAQLLIRLIRID